MIDSSITGVRRSVIRAAIACLTFACSAAVAATYQGRRVSDVLDELRAEGLTFIYNTALVSDDLVVGAEPRGQRGVELAREILRQHGLALSEVAPKTFAVLREESSQRPASVEPPARPPIVEEVVVQTSRYVLASDVAGSHAFLDQVQVTNLPRLGDETLQAVQRLPGVATNGFSSIASIRGGVANETAIVLDGLRLYEPFHLKNYLSPVSLLDSRLIAGLDVYFGGFPVTYGDRMSAIIDARSIRPEQARYYELGLSLFHANALAAGKFDDDRAQLLVSARRSNLSELAQFAENDFGKPEYSDGFARFDYRFSEATQGSLSTLMSHDRISAIRSGGTESARDESTNIYTWATLDHAWSESLSSRALASWTDIVDQRRGQVEDPGRRTGTVIDDRTFSVIGLRIDNDWNAERLVHRFGADVRRLWADYEYDANIAFAADFPFPGVPPSERIRSVVLHPDGFEASGYWDTRFDVSSRWTLEGGLRIDTQTYDGSGDAEQWSPRLSALYHWNPETRLRASWGRFHQSQGINELQVEDGVDRFYPAQYADHAIFSIERTFAGQLDARLELYQKNYRRLNPRFENLFDPLVLLPEIEFDRVRIAPDSARVEGAEVWFNWHPDSHWSGWLSYTWSQARDRTAGEDVYRSWDQRHAIGFGIAWTSGPWAATLANTFHTGWPTTQLGIAPDPEPGQSPLVLGPRNALRYDDFNSLDLRVTRTFELPRGQLDVFVEVTNMASRENPCCTEYRVIDTPSGPALESSTDNWLPLVPSLGVLWRYGRD